MKRLAPLLLLLLAACGAAPSQSAPRTILCNGLATNYSGSDGTFAITLLVVGGDNVRREAITRRIPNGQAFTVSIRAAEGDRRCTVTGTARAH